MNRFALKSKLDIMQEKRFAAEKVRADQILSDPALLEGLNWIERGNAVRLLDNVACRCEGKTYGEAQVKRKPYFDLMTKVQNKLEADRDAWVNEVSAIQK